jgi:hypothetical protein
MMFWWMSVLSNNAMVAEEPAGSEQLTVMLLLSLQSPSVAVTEMVEDPTCVQVNEVVVPCAFESVPTVAVQV